MLGLDVIEVMTPSGHPSIINKIRHNLIIEHNLAKQAKSTLTFVMIYSIVKN